MSRYTADSKDRVLQAVDMLSLVESRVDLRRAGVDSYFGLCPFHDERSGSFHVRPEEKHFHCFGCQESGDPFDFVMQTEGLDFKAALESLADRFGVKLETEDEDPAAAARRERRERLFGLLGRAAVYYSRYLWEAKEAGPAREYLIGRGFTEEILREFHVGYAPSAWDRMLVGSKRAGFTDEELLAVGLVMRSKTRQGSVYDRFRRRIMFPSFDARGKVRGFGARQMSPDQQPKYLNTSEGEIYHKREQLFGIDLARSAAARSGRMILVEGYTDVIALHQAGVRNTVAIMGTSFTEEQARELERIVGVLELCLDADRAGQSAMLRAAKVAAGSRLELRVVGLPEGTDPGDMILSGGAEALRARVEASVPFVVFQVERIIDRDEIRDAEAKDRAIEQLRPVLAELQESILRDELIRRIAGRLELAEGRVASLLARPGNSAAPPLARGAAPPGRGAGTGAERHGRGSSPESDRGVDPYMPYDAGAPEEYDDGWMPPPGVVALPPPEPAEQSVRTEHAFLALCIAMPTAGAAALATIDPESLITSGALRRAAYHLRDRTATPLSDLPPDDDELARTVADLVKRSGSRSDIGPDRLEHARLILELARVERAIKRARVERGPNVAALARERGAFQAQLHDVTSRLERTI